MDNHPHYIWAFVVVLIVGVVAWCYSMNRADVTTYARGSNSAQTDIKHYSLVDVNPCGVLFRLDSDKPMKAGKNGTLTNSVAK